MTTKNLPCPSFSARAIGHACPVHPHGRRPKGGGQHDERAVLEKVVESDRMYVMDRSYAKFALFNRIVSANSSYVCRLRDNSVWESTELRHHNDDAWQSLFDQQLTKWEKFLGVPTPSVKGLPEGTHTSDDGKTGTPLGLNIDPTNVYTVEQVDGEPVLRVTGEIFGGLTTISEYSNYHFRIQSKWGTKKYAPRQNRLRDSGILYHCVGDHAAMNNVWMQSLECQVQETDYGDFFALAGTSAQVTAILDGKFHRFDPSADSKGFGRGSKFRPGGVVKRSEDFGHATDWNTIEVLTVGDESYHVVNGKFVNHLTETKWQDGKQTRRLDRGKIQLQSEGAELEYRHCEIKKITQFPAKYRQRIQPSSDQCRDTLTLGSENELGD